MFVRPFGTYAKGNAPGTKRSKYAKRMLKRRGAGRKRVGRALGGNRATITEALQTSVNDGLVVFQRGLQLSNATFDRSQAVAQAYQEYCITSIKLTFRPSADTFTPSAGNSMPQLYYVKDLACAIPTNANLQTLLDMGVRPIRFDDKNIQKSFKPKALIGADVNAAGGISASVLSKPSPWLSTNANAGTPGAVWAPSAVEHNGCAFFVSKMSGLTPVLAYTVDIQVGFAFRKPLWRVPPGEQGTENVILNGDGIRPINAHAV